MEDKPLAFVNLGNDAFQDISRFSDSRSVAALAGTCKMLRTIYQEPLEARYNGRVRRIAEVIAIHVSTTIQPTTQILLSEADIAKATMGVTDCGSASDRQRIWISQLVSRSLVGEEDLPALAFTMFDQGIQAKYEIEFDSEWRVEVQIDFEDGVHAILNYKNARLLHYAYHPDAGFLQCKVFKEALELHPWTLGIVSALYSHHPDIFEASVVPQCRNGDIDESLDPDLCQKYDIFNAIPKY